MRDSRRQDPSLCTKNRRSEQRRVDADLGRGGAGARDSGVAVISLHLACRSPVLRARPPERALPRSVGGRRMRWNSAAVLSVSACMLAFPVPARGDARAEGTRAYRSGRYAEALAAFETAVRQRPSDPEPLADVALALQKLERNEEAVAANRKVVALAARPGKLKGARRAKIRQGAYFNLGKLGQVLRVPEMNACGTIETDASACKKPLYACRKAGLDAGSGLGTVWDVLRVDSDKEHAHFIKTSDDYDGDEYHNYPPLIRGVTDDSYNWNVHRGVDLSEEEGDGVLRYGVEEMGDECARIHGSEWTCDGSQAVRAETLRCVGDAEAGMISSLRTSATTAACFRKACDRAEKAPWTAVTQEEKEHDETLQSCYDGLSEIEDTNCVVVYADACTGFVGLYCTKTIERTRGKPKPARHTAYELKVPAETRPGS